MRKGSTKKVALPEPNPPQKPSTAPVSIAEYDKSHALGLPSIEKEVIDILLRLCDACHEIDNRIEPWAGIRKDIERLK
ncbi:MAG: hypothetical protein WC107_05660 [Patescibacteria group bacterium]|jgi:hypothetical protein